MVSGLTRLTTAILYFLLPVMGFSQAAMKVLVFSKTVEFRHESIPAGKKALEALGKAKGFAMNFTEESSSFNDKNLKNYNAVIFLNTTGDVLNNAQQESFERFIQAGGGYVGVHGAADCEYGWPWYGKLLGAVFLDHPTPNNIQNGKFIVTKKDHWLTKGMPEEFEKTDEFYNFKEISPKINVVLKLDEKSYQGGKNGDFHPASWYQEFDGGRSFYTVMGHTDEMFSNPLFLNHLYAGIRYAAGLPSTGGDKPKPLDYSKARPEENRFSKVILKDKLDEPTELSVLDNERVLFIQRKGEVRLYNNKTRELKTIATIPVCLECSGGISEDGLLGLHRDPNFAQNHWIYLYYSLPNKPKNVLTRYELRDDKLILESKKVLLEIPVQRQECIHTGGSIDFDKDGNLYLSTGDNTNPQGIDGYNPTDEREGRNPWDAQKSASNTNDLRGKILRIKPAADGSYTIPDGNLFPKGTFSGDDRTRPEIFSMGHRNPYRISIDQKNGYVYWGEVGPDATKADTTRGPEGQDEIGQARRAGNFGWPYFVGENKPYVKYDFETKKSGPAWDASAPANNSPNNTGLKILPPAKKAFIWYGYGESKEFPLMGSGGRNAMAGPVFYTDQFKNAARAFPEYYDGKLFIYEWMRGWIMVVTMDSEGRYESMERFMPAQRFSNPMDMEFAPNGDLYMLEYGAGWFAHNDDARLIRIEYNAGNRKPQIQLTADKMGGSIPLKVKLSAKGTTDADEDLVKYTWKITSKNGFNKSFDTQELTVNFTQKGVYVAALSANDGKGGISTQSVEITAGNEAPVVNLTLPGSNRSFYTVNKPFDYRVDVKDKEDGSLGKGIDPERVAVNIDYLSEGYDKIAVAMGHQTADNQTIVAKGKLLMDASDCMACHSRDKKSIGPTYVDIARKYKGNDAAIEKLAKKIINGGSGSWGETAMAAHPQISTSDASEIVKYIVNIEAEKVKTSLPASGSFTAKLPDGDKGLGVFIVRAAYQDLGTQGLPALKDEKILVLKNSKIGLTTFDFYDEVRKVASGGNNMLIPSKNGAFTVLKQIDIEHVREVVITAMAPKQGVIMKGGAFEIRLDSTNGVLVGKSQSIASGSSMTPLKAPVKLPENQNGKLHDVYLVFVNPSQEQRSLMLVFGVEFKLE
jgi:cytochrome c